MSRIVLLGPSSDEAARLSGSLTAADPDVHIVYVPDGGIADADTHDAVVIVSASAGHDDHLRRRVEAVLDAGLPVVVLLPGVDLFGLDPVRGHIDFCFPPFTPHEVLLRARAAAARAAGPGGPNMIRRGDLVIDVDSYQVTLEGRRIDLTFKEYELLRFLASSPGKAFSRQTLLRTVWGYDYFGGTRTVDVHVRRLRSKIDDVEHHFIETIWTVGYRFRGDDSPAGE